MRSTAVKKQVMLMKVLLPTSIVSLLWSFQAAVASPMTLEEVYNLYPRETLQTAISKNQISASTAGDVEAVPLSSRYYSVFFQLIQSSESSQERFSAEDWAKIISLPAHHNSRFALPQYFLMMNNCQEIEQISESGSATRAAEIGSVLLDQTWAEIHRIDQHYIDFIDSLSPEGQAELELAYEEIILNNRGSIGWSIRDDVGLAKDVPEFVEQNALRFCHVLSQKEAEEWAGSQDLLVDIGHDDNPEILMETIYAPSVLVSPVFDGDVFHLPLVKTENGSDAFQQVELKPVANGLWQLSRVIDAVQLENKAGAGMSTKSDVESGAVQVIARASGSFSGCERLGASLIDFDESNNRFFVDFYYSPKDSSDEVVCLALQRDYAIYQPLPVYGLPAGDYGVDINGEYGISFTLANDNVHPDFATSTVVQTSQAKAVLTDDNTLQVSHVNIPGQAGYYQQVELIEVENNLWRLSGIREGSLLEQIDSVELAGFGDDVKQVVLNVKGRYSNGCYQPGDVVSRFDNSTSTLEVNFYQYLPSETESSAGICAPGDDSYDLVYPLPIYAAPAGEYHVLVNGEHMLDFELEKDNVSQFNWLSSSPPLSR